MKFKKKPCFKCYPSRCSYYLKDTFYSSSFFVTLLATTIFLVVCTLVMPPWVVNISDPTFLFVCISVPRASESRSFPVGQRRSFVDGSGDSTIGTIEMQDFSKIKRQRGRSVSPKFLNSEIHPIYHLTI